MSSRILGMGDLLTLIEKASQEYDEKKSLELAEKMRENTFDFNDFIDQLDQVQNMGPMEDLLKMLQMCIRDRNTWSSQLSKQF